MPHPSKNPEEWGTRQGCQTWGHTREEALANVREAVELYVQDLVAAGDKIPVDRGTIELAEPAVAVNV